MVWKRDNPQCSFSVAEVEGKIVFLPISGHLGGGLKEGVCKDPDRVKEICDERPS